MELKAGQLIRNTGDMLRRIGLVTEIYNPSPSSWKDKGLYERLGKPELVPQAMVCWLYHRSAPNMVGQTVQIDTRQIYVEGDPRFYVYEIMQDEGGQPAAP